jgi:hypothetical protein
VYSQEAAIAPVAIFRHDFSANSTENSARKVKQKKWKINLILNIFPAFDPNNGNFLDNLYPKFIFFLPERKPNFYQTNVFRD